MERIIDDARPVWEAQSFPELMRIRDYFSFLQFAKDQQIILSVCGADPKAGRWIGRPGTRCYRGRLRVLESEVLVSAGLLAADPADLRLQTLLASYDPPFSYREYVEQLAAEGLRVLGCENNYVVEDDVGNRFHNAYRIHGICDSRSYEPVWSEKLRAALNRALGEDLVLAGPQDEWEHRNNRSIGGAWGPQAPVIEFKDGETIRNLLSVPALARRAQYRNRWAKLYPHHPVGEEV